MKKLVALFLAAIISIQSFAFCGFYVAKADIKLFNKTSQVIIAKNGEMQTVTMSSDFEGDVKDFAMVVPVPVILEEKDIRVVDRLLFDKLDTYSAPRLVEYYDNNPCYNPVYYPSGRGNAPKMAMNKSADMEMDDAKKDYGVTVEAKYTVGEYDILILSAKESGGLEQWLIDNGYKMPLGAKEVLDPYIKTNMKFFVCKVNLDNYNATGAVPLKPLQITYKSEKFMLPIRLGMANANGVQDLIVYMYSKIGRIETTNYRTALIPTDFKVPLFVQGEFGEFYRDLYNKAWSREGKNAVFLEYAWEVSPKQNMQFCDPCVGDPPIVTDLKEAGVDWLTLESQDYHTQAKTYAGDVYFTRMHLTYDREHFPQDLMFQETPNKERFQGRYILTHPANGDFSCEKGQTYIKDLSKRRWNELYTYQWLTGRDITAHYDYPKEYDVYLNKEEKKDGKKQGSIIPIGEIEGPIHPGEPQNNMLVFVISMITLAGVMFALSRKRVTK